jgi:hypothetical protein
MKEMKEKNTNKTWIIAIVKHFSPLNILQMILQYEPSKKKFETVHTP